MKLTGKVTKITRVMARSGRDAAEEKRAYHVTGLKGVRPTPGYYYDYGNMDFIVHQPANGDVDFFADLDQDVVLYVNPTEGEIANPEYEELRARVAELEFQLEGANVKVEEANRRKAQVESNILAAQAKLNAAMQEATRLMIMVETLQGARARDPHVDVIEHQGGANEA